jgi:LmbE family N-acetylglucosaminyl deacetylase
MSRPITDPAALGTVLGVWAHPDDEAYLSGGLMASAVEAGNRVVCVTATRGELGFADDDERSADERMAIRESELAGCLDTLGVTEHHWLDYGDGDGERIDPREASDRVAALIDAVQPDTVLTFGPDGMTGHVDHIAVSRWTTMAWRGLGGDPSCLLYATNTPEWADAWNDVVDPSDVMMVDDMPLPVTPRDELAVWLVLETPLLDRKVAALRCQASQVSGLAAEVGDETFARLNAEESFRWAVPTDWSD